MAGPQQGIQVIGIDGGLDTKSDPRQVKVPHVTTSQDTMHVTPGEVRKREAVGTLAAPVIGGGTIIAGYNIGTFKEPLSSSNELLVHCTRTNSTFPNVTELAGKGGTVDLTQIWPQTVQVRQAAAPLTDVFHPVTAVSTNSGTSYTLTMWGINNGQTTAHFSIYGKITSLVDGSSTIFTVSDGNLFGAVSCYTLCGLPGAGWMVALVTSSSKLVFFSVGYDGTLGSRHLAGTDPDTTVAQPIDMCLFNGKATVVETSSASASIYVLNNNGTVATTVSIPSGTGGSSAACFCNDTYLYYTAGGRQGLMDTSNSLGTGTAINAFDRMTGCFTSNGASTLAVSFIETVKSYSLSGYPSFDSSYMRIGQAAVTGLNAINITGTVTTTMTAVGGLGLLSRAAMIQGNPVVVCRSGSNEQPTLFLMDNYSVIVGRMAENLVANYDGVEAGVTNIGRMYVPGPLDVRPDSLGGWMFSYPQKFTVGSTGAGGNIAPMGVPMLAWISTPAVQPPMLQVGNQLHVPAMLATTYDGKEHVEEGFHFGGGTPIGTTYTAISSFNLPTGVYKYCCTYEYIDNQGNLHRSEPSDEVSVTVDGSTNNPNVTFPWYRPTFRGIDPSSANSCQLVVWRTLVNGGIFFRHDAYGTVPDLVAFNNAVTGSNQYYYQLLDDSRVSDDIISLNETLYTTDGTLVNHPTPMLSWQMEKDGRVYGISAVDPSKIYVSGLRTNGLALTWNRENFLQVSPETGGVTALGNLDDKIIIFTRDRYYVTTGTGVSAQGPELLGQSGVGYAPLYAPVTSVGCTAPGTVVSMKDGLIFQSRQGFMLLDRSLSLHYLAGPDSFASTYTYGRAFTWPERQLIIWPALGSGSTAPAALALDYEQNKWSVWTNYDATAIVQYGTGATMQKADGTQATCLVADTYVNGDGSFYPIIVETPWQPTGSLTGYGEIWEMEVLGEYKSPHTLQVEVAYNYGPYLTVPLTKSTTTALLNGDTVYQFRFRLPTPQCYAIRFRVRDLNQSGTGESCRISGLVLHLGVDQGLSRLSAAKSG